jgi:hypothetical protein
MKFVNLVVDIIADTTKILNPVGNVFEIGISSRVILIPMQNVYFKNLIIIIIQMDVYITPLQFKN